jgi:hypothetical protein
MEVFFLLDRIVRTRRNRARLREAKIHCICTAAEFLLALYIVTNPRSKYIITNQVVIYVVKT